MKDQKKKEGNKKSREKKALKKGMFGGKDFLRKTNISGKLEKIKGRIKFKNKKKKKGRVVAKKSVKGIEFIKKEAKFLLIVVGALLFVNGLLYNNWKNNQFIKQTNKLQAKDFKELEKGSAVTIPNLGLEALIKKKKNPSLASHPMEEINPPEKLLPIENEMVDDVANNQNNNKEAKENHEFLKPIDNSPQEAPLSKPVNKPIVKPVVKSIVKPVVKPLPKTALVKKKEVVVGTRKCPEKNDHPSKSSTKGKHKDEDCCPDPDEWANPECTYSSGGKKILIKKP